MTTSVGCVPLAAGRYRSMAEGVPSRNAIGISRRTRMPAAIRYPVKLVTGSKARDEGPRADRRATRSIARSATAIVARTWRSGTSEQAAASAQSVKAAARNRPRAIAHASAAMAAHAKSAQGASSGTTTASASSGSVGAGTTLHISTNSSTAAAAKASAPPVRRRARKSPPNGRICERKSVLAMAAQSASFRPLATISAPARDGSATEPRRSSPTMITISIVGRRSSWISSHFS